LNKLLTALCLVLNIVVLAGCTSGTPIEKPAWEISSTFGVPFKDDQGNERTFMLRGIENKLGITDAPLYVGVSQKVLWHFWGDPETLVGKAFKVEGTSAKSGEKIKLFEYSRLGLSPNLGATTSLPSGIKLTSTGLWKLDIYLDNVYYDSLIVQGIEPPK
jgi:hypothetical protein